MKASVIIPNLNGAGWLRDSIESVWAQTEQDFELIVIDTCIWRAFQKDRKFYCTIYWPVLFGICDRKFGISFGPSGGGDPGKSDQRDFRKMAVSSCSCSL